MTPYYASMSRLLGPEKALELAAADAHKAEVMCVLLASLLRRARKASAPEWTQGFKDEVDVALDTAAALVNA